jgi:hypothetical protein
MPHGRVRNTDWNRCLTVPKKRKKRNAFETLLQDVIETLELDDSIIANGETAEERRRLSAYRDVLVQLLDRGPLDIADGKHASLGVVEALNTRAIILQFLRSAVRDGERGRPSTPLAVRDAISFTIADISGGRVAIRATGDSVEDLVILQLVMLMSHVGLHNVRVCKATDCGSPPGTPAAPSSRRLYVKTYRREFCSEQCQKRVYMRQRRENERRQRERAARRRRGEQ